MATRFRLTNKTGRVMVLCSSLAINASCSNKDEVDKYAKAHEMNFGVSVPREWHTSPDARSAAEAQACYATQFDNSGLWLTVTSEPIGDTTQLRSPKTRAAAVTTDDFHDSFAVYGYAYKGANWNNRGDVITWFAGDKVSNNNGIWTTEQAKYWPGDSYRMHFIAYAPHPTDAIDPSPVTDEDEPGSLTVILAADNYTPAELKYTVPTKVTAQKDLVVATPDDVPGNHNQSVDLTFKHVLTAVRVTAAKGMRGTIKRVALAGMQESGIYDFSTRKWKIDTSNPKTRDFVIDMNVPLTNDENDTPLADGDYTFMMIPQLMHTTDYSLLEITINKDGVDKTFSHNLSTIGTWESGKRVTYRISQAKPDAEYEFSVTDPTMFSADGGSKSVQIQSYKTTDGVNKTPVPWENAGYYSKNADGEYTPIADVIPTPDWIHFPDYQDNEINYEIKVYPQHDTESGGEGENLNKTTTSQDETLKKIMQEIGSKENPVNLAGADGMETTANCYIVNAPGWYKFPIVYGNALKDGADNTDAYKDFVNHRDKLITAPWIKDNDIKVENALLIWKDAGFIEETSLQVVGDYIRFHIPPGENCVQGNAVIAVKDADANGDIAWSWHIWVTLCRPDETFEFGNYSFFKSMLGYREADLITYPKREVYVKLIQNESKKVKYVHVSQDYLHWYKTSGNAPYYQHGRKDPFPGSLLEIKHENGKYSFEVKHDRIANFGAVSVFDNVTLGDAIKNPDTYIGQAYGNANWYWYRGKGIDYDGTMETGYKNLWNHKDIKTVYDPCPAGYKVPTKAAFEQVAQTDNAKVEYINTGLFFVNNKYQENEQRLFLQIVNSRIYEGKYNSGMDASSAHVSLYCNESNGSTFAHFLYFNDTNYWLSVEPRPACAGRCILPQKE